MAMQAAARFLFPVILFLCTAVPVPAQPVEQGTVRRAEPDQRQRVIGQAVTQLRARLERLRTQSTDLESELEKINAAWRIHAQAMMRDRRAIAPMLALLTDYASLSPWSLLLRPQDAAMVMDAAAGVEALIPDIRARSQALRARFLQLDKVRRTLREKQDHLAQLHAETQKGLNALSNLNAQAAQTVTSLPELAHLLADPRTATAPLSFRAPVPGKIVATFGKASAGGQRHQGLTFATDAGASVMAPADGRVIFARTFRGYGPLILIEHARGLTSLVWGLERLDVVLGSSVKAGMMIGRVNAQRQVHFELRESGVPIDPLPLMRRSAKAGQG